MSTKLVVTMVLVGMVIIATTFLGFAGVMPGEAVSAILAGIVTKVLADWSEQKRLEHILSYLPGRSNK